MASGVFPFCSAAARLARASNSQVAMLALLVHNLCTTCALWRTTCALLVPNLPITCALLVHYLLTTCSLLARYLRTHSQPRDMPRPGRFPKRGVFLGACGPSAYQPPPILHFTAHFTLTLTTQPRPHSLPHPHLTTTTPPSLQPHFNRFHQNHPHFSLTSLQPPSLLTHSHFHTCSLQRDAPRSGPVHAGIGGVTCKHKPVHAGMDSTDLCVQTSKSVHTGIGGAVCNTHHPAKRACGNCAGN